MTNKKQLGGSADYQGCNRWEELLTCKYQLGGSADYQGCNRWEELLTSKYQLGDLLTTKDATGGRSC